MMRSESREASGLSSADIPVLLDAIAAVAESARLAFLWRPALRDPDDDMVLETAVNGMADAVVTFNIHDFAGVAARFGLEVLTPGRVEVQLDPAPRLPWGAPHPLKASESFDVIIGFAPAQTRDCPRRVTCGKLE